MGTVLITGCSSGIGLETALAFSRQGHTVFAGMREVGRSQELRRRSRAEGLSVRVVPLDVVSDSSVQEAMECILREMQGLDVLVNNAGVSAGGPVEEIGLDTFGEVFDVNFLGPVRMAKAVLPAMRAQGSGCIVNVASLSGVVGGPFLGCYGASKAAILSLSEALYFETAGFGVRVRVVVAGQYRTSIVANAKTAAVGPESPYVALADRIAATRLPNLEAGDPEEVARAIVGATEDGDDELMVVVGDHTRTLLERRQATPWGQWAAQVLREPGKR